MTPMVFQQIFLLKKQELSDSRMRGMQLYKKNINWCHAHSQSQLTMLKAGLFGIDYSIHIYCRVQWFAGHADSVSGTDTAGNRQQTINANTQLSLFSDHGLRHRCWCGWSLHTKLFFPNKYKISESHKRKALKEHWMQKYFIRQLLCIVASRFYISRHMFIYETCVKIKFAMPWYRNFSKHTEGFCVSVCEQWYFIIWEMSWFTLCEAFFWKIFWEKSINQNMSSKNDISVSYNSAILYWPK